MVLATACYVIIRCLEADDRQYSSKIERQINKKANTPKAYYLLFHLCDT